MTTGELIAVMQQAMYTMLAIGGPIVGASLVVGLAVSIFQAATQINEATLTFVPKLIVVALILLSFGPGMAGQLTDFTRMMFAAAASAAR